MSKGYILADGSLSTDYEIGDEFVVSALGSAYDECLVELIQKEVVAVFPKMKPEDGNYVVVKLLEKGEGDLPVDTQIQVRWKNLRIYRTTRRATQFQINKGDYIDSREFTREECERFCELAVECGFERGASVRQRDFDEGADFDFIGLGRKGYLVFVHYGPVLMNTNITTQFREFLDKEEGMKQGKDSQSFTKDGLKDGMRVEFRDRSDKYDFLYVVGARVIHNDMDDCIKSCSLDSFDEGLKSKYTEQEDIMRVTDRDGTVLFEREEEPKELTLEEIAQKFDMPVDKIRIKK